MVQITDNLNIDDNELTWSFVRAGGPGGQNVNKVASKAVVRWDLANNQTLSEEVKQRLRQQQKRRMTTGGEMILTSQKYRDQERNREDCLEKLRQAIMEALVVARPRKATKPTKGSRARRLQQKRHRASTKSLRRPPGED